MRIDLSNSLTQTTISFSAGTVEIPGAIKSVNRDGEVSAAKVFSPTTDLARLISAVKELPDVRADVVQGVSDRVASGEVFTPSAASDTAAALLESKDI